MRLQLGLGQYFIGVINPLNIQGLQFWGNADSANIVLNTGKVSQMTDLSGNGNHAVQATAGSRPLIATAALNGRDVMTMASASSQCLIIPYAAGLQPSSTFSVFAVWRWNDASHGASFTALVSHTSSGAWSDGWALSNAPAGTDGQFSAWHNSYSNASLALRTTFADTTWRATAVVYDGTNPTMYTDGASTATHADGNATTYSNNCQTVIGAYNSASGGPTVAGFTNADLAELIIANQAFSAGTLAGLHARAKLRYGTP